MCTVRKKQIELGGNLYTECVEQTDCWYYGNRFRQYLLAQCSNSCVRDMCFDGYIDEKQIPCKGPPKSYQEWFILR